MRYDAGRPRAVSRFKISQPRTTSLLSVSNSLSGRHWELDQVPAVGDPTDIVQLDSGAMQRCLNPGFSEKIRNSRRTGRYRWHPSLRTGLHVLVPIDSACLAIVTSETSWSVPIDVGRQPRERASRIVDNLDATGTVQAFGIWPRQRLTMKPLRHDAPAAQWTVTPQHFVYGLPLPHGQAAIASEDNHTVTSPRRTRAWL